MATRDPRVDDYIEAAGAFARPILRHLRDVVHTACPDVEETMRWSMPNFDYQGILCSMAAFKAHCTFGFWKPKLVLGEDGESKSGMGQLGKIASLEDLPSDEVLIGHVKKAMQLNEAGVKPARLQRSSPRKKKPPVDIPDDLRAALEASPEATATFEGFSPSHRREYVEWITEAKRDATRERRIAQAVEWMAEGKPRNWKYM